MAESIEKKGKNWPLSNHEAVKKYREKKKARAASLEDEVVRLRAKNQHLMKRLQGQALLEAEIVRLKCLLVDIRGRMEGKIGSFSYQKLNKARDIYRCLGNHNIDQKQWRRFRRVRLKSGPVVELSGKTCHLRRLYHLQLLPMLPLERSLISVAEANTTDGAPLMGTRNWHESYACYVYFMEANQEKIVEAGGLSSLLMLLTTYEDEMRPIKRS
ncbi:Basic-leucine zipper (bZIP) transcription factor family protein [Striga hermonthica]|uniref:Basic-leucine zipper (BZIP) transcription factor family protein n=1 Tax=Striga hermonthica TaxID=68872 RepID=A0A9N7RR27_STRHE|nr:Basic-leucine zipper (bZIP) transcription factor family protein [Striga hermonthica]